LLCDDGTAFESSEAFWRYLIAAAPTPAPDHAANRTTGDKYRAELYDEVWQKARDMGYGNVTEALTALERLKDAPDHSADDLRLVAPGATVSAGFSVVNGKHIPTITVSLESCRADDMLAFDKRDLVAESIRALSSGKEVGV
jgi:hypothetical protein